MPNTYRYPQRDVDRTGLYLCFQAYDYKSVDTDRLIKITNDESKVATARRRLNEDLKNGKSNKREGSADFIADIGESLKAQLSEVGGRVKSSFTPSSSLIDAVYLYLPPKLEYEYSANWQKVQLGALGSGTSIGGAIGAAAGTGANSIFNLLNGALTNVPKVENLSLDGLIGATLGLTFNDNTVQSFDKMNPRTFGFEYVMVARNAEEQAQIENIIKTFKLGMHPVTTTTDNAATGLFLGYPAVWTIRPAGLLSVFKVRNRDGVTIEDRSSADLTKFLPATEFCALTNVKVDYTPENNIAMLNGGFVQAVRLSLSFTELTTLTREDVERLDYTVTRYPRAKKLRKNSSNS